MLELGCGDGGNLVPMALTLPEARFLGVDSAPGAVGRGRELARAVGVENVELAVGAIEELELPRGGFDYVIAHGVYSWVPAPVRDRLLALCREVLSERGIAYVSYNVLPGGRLRQGLRDMMLFHAGEAGEPGERIAQARALLAFLIEGWSDEHDFGRVMRREAQRLLERGDEALFHDDLAEVDEFVPFHRFAAHAAQHGLQFLAEADFFEMQTAVAPDAVAETLVAIDDPLRREQYLDFLKGRVFRQTLLCRDELEVDRSVRPELLDRLAVSSPARAEGSPDQAGRVTFRGPAGSALTTDQLLVVRSLEEAGSRWPEAVWVRELGAEADVEERAALLDALLRCYAGNLVALHVRAPALTTTAGERPEASPLARHQARRGSLVTSLRHTFVRIEDDLGRRLVILLDGTRDRAALAAELRAFVLEGGGEVPADLEEGLDRSLEGLGRLGLLVDRGRSLA